MNKEEIDRSYYYNSGNIRREYYFLNNKYHRENGPAIIWYNENGNILEETYYLNGIEITDDFVIMVMNGLKE